MPISTLTGPIRVMTRVKVKMSNGSDAMYGITFSVAWASRFYLYYIQLRQRLILLHPAQELEQLCHEVYFKK
jgi:hypothetical protein